MQKEKEKRKLFNFGLNASFAAAHSLQTGMIENTLMILMTLNPRSGSFYFDLT